MALMCPSCGAENRDKARFCRGCARPLDRAGGERAAVDPAAADAARARRLARRQRHAKAHRPAWSRWAGVMVAAAIALGAGWWLGARQTTPAPALAAPLPVMTSPVAAPAEAPPTAAPAAVPASSGAPPAAPSAADAVDRLRHSVEALEQQDRARAAARTQQQARVVQERLRAEDARRRTDALAASAVAGATTPPAPAAATVATAPAPAAPVQAVAAPSVDQLCAGSGNVLARDFCRMRECGKAVFAADAVCVRFRQMDEARRQDN